MTLTVLVSEQFATEQDPGEVSILSYCFLADINTPLDRSAVFYFDIMPNTTAIESEDYTVGGNPLFFNSSLIIPEGTSGQFVICIHVFVLGDSDIEATESAVFEITAESTCDQLIFPPGSPPGLLTVTIFDDDGEKFTS